MIDMDYEENIIEQLRRENKELKDVLKLTQDLSRMTVLIRDPKHYLNPIKGVDYFNSIFPEIKRAIDKYG